MKIPQHLLFIIGSVFLVFIQAAQGDIPGIISGPKGSVMSIAHRGDVVPDYPENTLMAFSKAIELGSEVVEIDLRRSKDGEIVILHDSTLDRTTDGKGPVIDYSLLELKQLNVGMGERIPIYDGSIETDLQLKCSVVIGFESYFAARTNQNRKPYRKARSRFKCNRSSSIIGRVEAHTIPQPQPSHPGLYSRARGHRDLLSSRCGYNPALAGVDSRRSATG